MIHLAKKQLAKKMEEWRKQDESERAEQAEQAQMTEGEGPSPSDTVPWFFVSQMIFFAWWRKMKTGYLTHPSGKKEN